MRRCEMLILLLILVTGLFAECDVLWQDNGIPLVTSRDVRWYGNAVELPDGGSIVVWTELITEDHDLFGMRLDSDGQKMWDEPRLFFNSEYPIFDEKITLSSDGYIYMSWFTYYDYKVNLNKFDLEGNTLWNECYSQESYVGFDGERVNRDLVPDQDGGVYLLWKYEHPSFAMRIADNGTPMWDNPIQLFDGYDEQSILIKLAIEDGHNGFIVGTNFYAGSGNYTNLLERVTPDGVSAWCNEMPNGYDPMIKQISDNEFSFIYTEHVANNEDCLYLYRIDLDGEYVNAEPVLIEDGLDYSITSTITSDAEGNIYAGWSYRKNSENNVSIAKVTPDNQTSWQYNYTPDGTRSYDMRIGLDSSGNIYQSWLGSSANGINILKLNPNGELSWSSQTAGNPETYEGYINLVMNIDEDDEVSLIWGDRRDNHQTIIQQKYHADGTTYFEEDGEVVRQSWDCSFNESYFPKSDEPLDNLFFAWTNRLDDTSYMQRIDMDGNLDFDDPGLMFMTQMNYEDEIASIYPVDDNYLITWVNNDEDQNHMFVNTFDSQGNRLWAEDLEVESIGTAYDKPRTAYMDGVLYIYWLSYTSGWTDCLEAQRVIDGELAWETPVVICNSLGTGYINVIEDYVFYHNGNETYAQRLDADGNPCDGFGAEGSRLNIDGRPNPFWTKSTDEGIVIVWTESSNPRMQILHENGTSEWESSLNLFPNQLSYLYHIEITDNGVYVFYYYQSESMVQAFDFDGTELWDTPVELFSDINEFCDIETTQNGLLIAYTVYHTDTDYRIELMLQHLDIFGNFWNEPMSICNAFGYRYNAEITPATNNRYFVTWLEARDVMPNYSLFGQLVDYQPNDSDESTNIAAWEPDMNVYPNPFNPKTTVSFSLASDSKVEMKVYNVKGQMVQNLCDDVLPVGKQQITWDGTDKTHKAVASGLYLINLNINGKDYRSKALLLK